MQLINRGRKKEVRREEIFAKEIDLKYLKKIDAVFNKGLSFYLDPSNLSENKEASIFFRKSEFNSELNLKSRKVVNEFEELKVNLSAMAKLSEVDIQRTLPVYSLSDNAKMRAKEVRGIINPLFKKGQKEYLTSLINKLAGFNVLVLEFVETWNQKERANIDGVFLSPNVIVLKRQEGHSFKREIFTLAHEFAHYLLNIEEIERIDYEVLADNNLSKVEQWCNEFAFYFLLGNYDSVFSDLPYANPSNDYHHDIMEDISMSTHVSKMALYTRLLFNDKISYESYSRIKYESDQAAKDYYQKQKEMREAEKAKGGESKGRTPKPIKSNLLISTIQTAFYEGIIDEYQVCKTLKIPPERLGHYIQ